MKRKYFPFSAILGQENLKKALLLNAVNPRIGGVLVRGEKGTAKSTAVRALGALLANARNGSGGDGEVVVTLPLNATEEMVAGGIDFQQTMKQGRRVFQPGLLAKAHEGILYVDEVNLLDDHLVDIVLDAASSGENRVEREGITLSHPALFVLAGTMNPEEGELRPQLLDRFGLCVEVRGETDPALRVDLMLRREAFDREPEDFSTGYRDEEERLGRTIADAQSLLPSVRIPSHLRGFISELCRNSNVAGHRADLVIEQAARANAALRGSREVSVEDVTKVAGFALVHRRRDPVPPPEQKPQEPERQEEQPRKDQPQPEQPEERGDESQQQPRESGDDSGNEEMPQPESGEPAEQKERPDNEGQDELFSIGQSFRVRSIATPKDRKMRRGSGKRSRSRVSQKQGRYTRSTMPRGNNDIALDATLRAAAPFQRHRENPNGMAVVLQNEDIREKIREKRLGNLLIFVVDASGSMGARGRMAASKGAVMSLLLDAYQKRDKLAMVSFRKDGAVVNLPVTSSIELAARMLKEMPVGGRTPFSAGLLKGYEIAQNYLRKEPGGRPLIILVTDGKANRAIGQGKPLDEAFTISEKISREERIRFLVVDTEEPGLVNFGLAKKIAGLLDAWYYRIDDLRADTLVSIVKSMTP
ncbi:MAG: putative cobaltochelatase [Chlorobiaceae bacterium]|nr:putative cobaltochelatase [Chlorobiaceae bacterium]